MSGKPEYTPWLIPGFAMVNLVVFTVLWAGGTIGVALAGYGWQSPPFTLSVYFALLSGSADEVWPGVPPLATYGGAVALIPLVVAPVAMLAPW
ncbi:hypothetical protein Psuf_038490 [Phytohabitans suffuscus]|uniref:Uncharacterized protein n=1 Tax=Phytohabitans suffuscus TaxID=624315 RepID=A0A6F8YKE0_9ACTN|nr:hypothetical protein [Phytohabitans suffuscus]BCB86536.1 hypothetical protein Psuf_038490 [Phytohabitans suffuscus]